jgi:hypothetical protein
MASASWHSVRCWLSVTRSVSSICRRSPVEQHRRTPQRPRKPSADIVGSAYSPSLHSASHMLNGRQHQRRLACAWYTSSVTPRVPGTESHLAAAYVIPRRREWTPRLCSASQTSSSRDILFVMTCATTTHISIPSFEAAESPGRVVGPHDAPAWRPHRSWERIRGPQSAVARTRARQDFTFRKSHVRHGEDGPPCTARGCRGRRAISPCTR